MGPVTGRRSASAVWKETGTTSVLVSFLSFRLRVYFYSVLGGAREVGRWLSYFPTADQTRRGENKHSATTQRRRSITRTPRPPRDRSAPSAVHERVASSAALGKLQTNS